MKNKKIALCVLAKYPLVGNVKTRLAKKIDPKKAVKLYYELLVNTIEQVKLAKVPHDIFIVSSDIENKNSLEFIFLNKADLVFYKEKSLAVLLLKIFEDFMSNKGYAKVLVTCSDSPFITPDLVLRAYCDLENNNTLFISPSSDGGYSLVGLNKLIDIFSSVVMSTDKVLKDTIEVAKSHDLNICMSEIVDDIDNIQDVYRLNNKITDKHDPLGRVRREIEGIIK